jgi:hypothetical protein
MSKNEKELTQQTNFSTAPFHFDDICELEQSFFIFYGDEKILKRVSYLVKNESVTIYLKGLNEHSSYVQHQW